MAQMTHFWRSCGIAPFASSDRLHRDALLAGLDGLMNWDASDELKALPCPVLALAARHDEIVPEAMSRTIWKDQQIVWSDESGHALPLTQPDWCAEQISNFVGSLQAHDHHE